MGQDQGKTYSLKYHRLAEAEAKRLDAFWQGEVLDAVESKLSTQPELFGKPLRRTLKGCRSLRVGDYRVVFQIQPRTVRIVAIIHRSTDYRDLEGRI